MSQETFSATEIPVSIVMQREEVKQKRWSFPRWQVLGVVAGEKTSSCEVKRTLIHCDDDRQEYLWRGFTLQLFKDGAESYWYNLIGEKPSLFVVCREDEVGAMTPMLVTANHDEANAYLEADDTVFSVAMPPEVYHWMEHYVVENYIPEEKKKRKRKQWKSENGRDKRF